ncbi:hypothetical protein B0H03_12521, partial [Rathayibacter iranicus NCPPB 2253 = VKM Ac-1602]
MLPWEHRELRNGWAAPQSVKAIFDEWHLDEFADDAFVDQDVAVTKQLEELQRC